MRIARLGRAVCAAALFGWIFSGSASANVFNMPSGQTSLELVPVGNLSNPADPLVQSNGTSGYGSVGYNYNISKFETTAGQYTQFLNAVAATDTYGLYNALKTVTSTGAQIQRSGSSGSYNYSVATDWANRPMNFVSWGDAARFANWLTNGQPTGAQNASTTEDGSYLLNGATTDAALLAVTRKSNAQFVVPSNDEWYKAAYHKNDGVTGNYWKYATSTNSLPSNTLSNPSPDPGNNANFYDNSSSSETIDSPYHRTEVGDFENSESPYGTFDQNGNVWEWNEAVVNSTYRNLRGGAWSGGATYLEAYYSGLTYIPSQEFGYVGFRIAEVPEPGSAVLMGLSGLLLTVHRKRR